MCQPVPYRDDLVNRALALYPLDRPKARFVRHNQSLVVEVEADARRYVLRIHLAASANLGGAWFDPALLESEMAWLAALSRDTDLLVQEPVATRDGSLIGSVAAPAGSVGCSLLTWIDAEPFEPDGPGMERWGLMVRAMHDHARRWTPPPGFVRPSYDRRHFAHVLEQLHPALSNGWLTGDDFAVLERAVEECMGEFDRLEHDPAQWGLIHADLGPSNVLAHPRGLSPIDFTLCGYGPYLWDLGGELVAYPKELRQAPIDAYGRPPAEAKRAMDACALLSVLGCFALHISNPARHERLARRVPRSVDREWRPFLAGEDLLFTI